MDGEFYVRPLPLSGQMGRRRIFSPHSYPAGRNRQIIPVVHMEALDLAAWFPVVWTRHRGTLDLVVLRSLLADGAGHPHGSPQIPSSLPLLIKAYPLVVDPTQSGGDLRVDDVIADEPTDVGATLLTERGLPSRALEERIIYAHRFSSAHAVTQRMGDHLSDAGLFQPWDLSFPDQLELGPFPEFLVVRPDAYETDGFISFARAFGAAGLRLLNAHALSLYRTAILYQRARQDLSRNAAA
ncbi:SapC family protein [Aquabacter sp. L1I39]|uniref:SapC family protein n=1 Tax=Aquabacter sp. L1I39 TaxID=2820278 RepID=UPI001ADC0F0E|nr:SapC family protein [Aquabacter sp. L1I39]